MRFRPTITRDNATVKVKVNAVVYFRVIDPEEAVVKALENLRWPTTMHVHEFIACQSG